MIESCYWKNDLLAYAKKFKPVKKPARWTEKKQVNFEKEVILSLFMIRKLYECHKFSSKTKKHTLNIFRSSCVKKVNNRNFHSIEELYDLDDEEEVKKDVIFLCNQFIHGGALFAYREIDRNWHGIYTCSDFERQKFIYRIPISEIIELLEIAANDYPSQMSMIWCDKIGDYKISTN